MLTAIVITLAVTVFMLSLAVVGRDDDTHDIPDTGEDPPDAADPTAVGTAGTAPAGIGPTGTAGAGPTAAGSDATSPQESDE